MKTQIEILENDYCYGQRYRKLTLEVNWGERLGGAGRILTELEKDGIFCATAGTVKGDGSGIEIRTLVLATESIESVLGRIRRVVAHLLWVESAGRDAEIRGYALNVTDGETTRAFRVTVHRLEFAQYGIN